MANQDLLLISWNVAGWTTTHASIRAHYQDLAKYLDRMGRPAIFCIQETKIQGKALKNEEAAKDLGAVIPGYRSFWSLNEDKDPKKAYLQGVATWVRNDVSVLAASQVVFEDSELDMQGRALLTDHGSFGVLNVYAPHIGPAADEEEKLEKLRFMEGLGSMMERLACSGKRVILCGDLNLTHRPTDQKPYRRVLWVNEVGQTTVRLPTQACKSLQQMGADSQETDAAGENAGPAPLESAAAAETALLPMTLGPFLDWANRWIPVKEVADRSSVPAKALAITGECMHIAEGGGVPWLRKLVSPPQVAPWADVFAEVHPSALDRFTCWSHSHNLRYPNIGTRLDYIITDRKTFAECVVRSPSSVLPGSVAAKEDAKAGGVVEATSEIAACNAATHYGGWHPAARMGIAQGDGLSHQVDNMRLNDTQFPQEPATGMIYTPPCYSDHIPVSALFTEALLKPQKAKAEQPWKAKVESETRKAQPWRGQPSIAAFFKSTPSKTSSSLPAAKKPRKV